MISWGNESKSQEHGNLFERGYQLATSNLRGQSLTTMLQFGVAGIFLRCTCSPWFALMNVLVIRLLLCRQISLLIGYASHQITLTSSVITSDWIWSNCQSRMLVQLPKQNAGSTALFAFNLSACKVLVLLRLKLKHGCKHPS